jgi:flagellar biosynthesis chaperone FliJ
MKRFVSRYEKIRRLRAQQEDVCRAAAAARNAERIQAEQRRDEAELRLSRFETETAAGMKLGITGSILQSMASQIERAKHQIKLDNEALRLADDRLEIALQEHKEARAELRIVEEMIHRELTEHRKAQMRIEENQLLEQAVQTYYRKMELNQDSES